MKDPTADPTLIAKKAKHMKPWVAWPALLLVTSFVWHYFQIPVVGQTAGQLVVKSVNPFTNAIVITAPAGNGLVTLGYKLGVDLAEKDMERKARENFDLWGMLIGYSVRVES